MWVYLSDFFSSRIMFIGIVFSLINVIMGIVMLICFSLKKETVRISLKMGIAYEIAVLYGAFLCVIAILGIDNWYGTVSINYSMFHCYVEMFYEGIHTWQLMVVIFNILLFIPFGVLFPLIFKNHDHYRWVLIYSIVLGGIIEYLQYLFGSGIMDYDDIFHHVIGGLMGLGIYRFFNSFKTNREHKALYVFSSFLPLILYAGFLFGGYMYHEKSELGFTYRENITNQSTKYIDFDCLCELDDKKNKTGILEYKYDDITTSELKNKCESYAKNIGLKDYDIQAVEDGVFLKCDNVDITMMPGIFIYSNLDVDITHIEVTDDVEEVVSNISAKLAELGIVIDDSYEYKFNITDRLEIESMDISAEDLYGYEDVLVPYNSLNFYKKAENDDYVTKSIICNFDKKYNIGLVSIYTYKAKHKKDLKIYTEKEAYERLCQGWTVDNLFSGKVTVYDVELVYEADTKGYGIPLYRFDCEVQYEGDISVTSQAFYVKAKKR